jgi:uncharacterized protein YjbI with pentapeptide repeats
MAPEDAAPVPRIPSALAAHDGSALRAESDYEAVAFTDLQLTGEVAEDVRCFGCAFSHCTLTDCSLPRAMFRDVTFEQLRAVGVDLAESAWLDVTVSDSLLAGTVLFDAEPRRVTFRDCKLDAVNLRGAQLTEVRFERCVLQDVDFTGATLRHTSFSRCQLLAADFSRATLDEVDLRGSELAIERGYEALGGAIVDSAQVVALAPALARHLGIEVRDR